MVTDRQVRIIEEWDKQDEGNKKEVRRKFKDSLEILPLLLKIPPDEARLIVEDAIYGYAEIDDKSRLPDKLFNEEIDTRAYYFGYFVQCIIAILFNGVVESKFEEGVKTGIQRVEAWWEQHYTDKDDPATSIIQSIPDPNFKIDEKITLRNPIIRGPKTPDNKRERLRWIVDGDSDINNMSPDMIDSLLAGNVFERDIQELEERLDEIEEKIDDYDSTDDDSEIYDILGLEDPEKIRQLIKVRETIEKSRELASIDAMMFQNPDNNLSDLGIGWLSSKQSTPKTMDHQKRLARHFIELHRDYLEERDLLPEEEKLPDCPNFVVGAPDPAKLEFIDYNDESDV